MSYLDKQTAEQRIKELEQRNPVSLLVVAVRKADHRQDLSVSWDKPLGLIQMLPGYRPK